MNKLIRFRDFLKIKNLFDFIKRKFDQFVEILVLISTFWGCCSDGGWAADCKSVTMKHRGFESLQPHREKLVIKLNVKSYEGLLLLL